MAYYLDNEKEPVFSSYFDDILKASYNLIDLIEEGDYVNGCLVIKDIKGELRFIDNEYRVMRYVKNNEIKSIVTKEQFETMKYVIEK